MERREARLRLGCSWRPRLVLVWLILPVLIVHRFKLNYKSQIQFEGAEEEVQAAQYLPVQVQHVLDGSSCSPYAQLPEFQ